VAAPQNQAALAGSGPSSCRLAARVFSRRAYGGRAFRGFRAGAERACQSGSDSLDGPAANVMRFQYGLISSISRRQMMVSSCAMCQRSSAWVIAST
jgi:hypothetical protein